MDDGHNATMLSEKEPHMPNPKAPNLDAVLDKRKVDFPFLPRLVILQNINSPADRLLVLRAKACEKFADRFG